jgi:acetate---CoA ligase (ADP-forming)
VNTSLLRLLNPRSIAVVGGHWADALIEANRTLGYGGEIWHVHPTRAGCHRSIEQLPGSPDATFIGVLAQQVPVIARQVRARNGGGFVCFASGFEETGHGALTQELLAAAGTLPFLGTNCYGFINFFDGVALWPDKVSRQRPGRGVALICQSGGVGIGFTHSQRSLQIGYLISIGNQTNIAVEDLIEALVGDERVSAFGLYIEGIKDLAKFKQAVARARAAGKPVALIKAGRTAAATAAAQTHTASITGDDREFDSLCAVESVARCDTLATLIETLKVFHMGGPLRGNKVLAIAASAGYAIMTSDAARNVDLDFAAIPEATARELAAILGPRIVIANPFDFQTLHWHDQARMRAMFEALFAAGYDAIAFMFGYPPLDCADTSGYDMPIDEFMDVAGSYTTRAAVLAPLPEFFSEKLRRRCIERGVIPLQGHFEGLAALSAAGRASRT